VREHLSRASITIHADNRTIFEEIIADRADVMITDGVEVRLQTRRHPELQATMTTPFTRVGKAILLPANSDLPPRIDAWLSPLVDRGEIAQRVETELNRSP
jgi:cyclohexadienyl dehydratase